jgi:hypothetical protein
MKRVADPAEPAEPLRLARSYADFLRECKTRYSAIPKPKTETVLRPFERLFNGRHEVGGRWGKYE